MQTMYDTSQHTDVNLDHLAPSLETDDTSAVASGSLNSSSADSKRERENRKKREMAAKRRERMMSQMARWQRNFIRENRELFETTPSESLLMSRDDSM